MIEEHSIFGIKGSGSTRCLLGESGQDEINFKQFKVQFQLKEIELSGLFVLAQSTSNDLYLWGTLSALTILQPKKIKQKVNRISCGWNHSVFQSQGLLYGLGSNAYKQMGIETKQKYFWEPQVIWKEGVDHFKAGFRQTYFISNGRLYGCGQSKKGELGVISMTYLLTTCIVDNLNEMISSNIRSIQSTKRGLFLQSQQNCVYGFGFNEQNSFANNQIQIAQYPIPLFQNVKKISCGWAHILILNNDGIVLSFGRNNLGQLGRNNESNQIKFDLDKQEIINDICSGSEYGFAITNFGKLYGWGWNEHFNISNQQFKIIQRPILVNTLGLKCSKLWTKPAITLIKCIQ